MGRIICRLTGNPLIGVGPPKVDDQMTVVDCINCMKTELRNPKVIDRWNEVDEDTSLRSGTVMFSGVGGLVVGERKVE